MNFETYLTNTIQEAVQEAVQKEFDKLKEEGFRAVKPRKTQKQNKKNSLDDRIIRPSKLAKLLSISRVTIWRMEKEGELPPRIKISNRAVGWLRSDIEDWLESRKQDD